MPEKKKLTDKEQQTAIDKVLGEPIFDGFTENVYRVRRNLLAFAVLSLIVTLNDLTINETNLPVKGLSDEGMHISLFLITSYHLIHFLVYVAQYWSQWRIRLTGKKLAYKVSNGGQYQTADEMETPPHQSTLYSWWREYKKYYTNAAQYEISPEFFIDMPHSQHLIDVKNAHEQVSKYLSDSLTKERLARFDKKFWKFQHQQHFNWLIFEVSIPVALGVVALIELCLMLY